MVKCLLANVVLLTSYGVPIELIRKHVLYRPGHFVKNPKVFKDFVMRDGMKLGITRHLQTTESCVNYLMDSLGFSHQQALSVSTKLFRRRNKVYDFVFVDNATSVINLLIQLGFDDTLIKNIVSKQPQLLASKLNKTLKPKIRLLQDEDFSASDIIRLISRCPIILCLGLETTLLPAIQNLKQVTCIIEKLSKDGHFRYVVKCLLPNVALLTSYGVPIELIRKQLLNQPGYYGQNVEPFKDIVMRFEKKLGINQNSPKYLFGLHFISERTVESVESKCQIFKSFGWTQSDIETFIMRNAKCLTFSDESIKKKLDFLMNELQLTSAYLLSHYSLFICSLEKRIVPRHKFLLILKEKGFERKNASLHNAISMSEPCFLKYYVMPFKEAHEAYAKLTGCSVKILTQESS